MIAIVDYGMGNLRSAQKAFERNGASAVITDDPARIADADAVVLPGVGAYRDCWRGLEAADLVEPVREAAASGRPFLGICVGMQLLFEGSDEGPCEAGLGVFAGRVVRFPDLRAQGLKVPHMGWNQLEISGERSNPLFTPGTAPYAYFVHSYYAQPADDAIVLARCTHGVPFTAAVGRGNVYAVQFHPEKSQAAGLRLLAAFAAQIRKAA